MKKKLKKFKDANINHLNGDYEYFKNSYHYVDNNWQTQGQRFYYPSLSIFSNKNNRLHGLGIRLKSKLEEK